MTIRRLSLPAPAALELLCGLALMAAPFVLGFATAGMVLAVGLGVLLTGLALSGGEGLALGAHLALDQLAARLALTAGTRWTRG
jgi:hypothetical protein